MRVAVTTVKDNYEIDCESYEIIGVPNTNVIKIMFVNGYDATIFSRRVCKVLYLQQENLISVIESEIL